MKIIIVSEYDLIASCQKKVFLDILGTDRVNVVRLSHSQLRHSQSTLLLESADVIFYDMDSTTKSAVQQFEAMIFLIENICAGQSSSLLLTSTEQQLKGLPIIPITDDSLILKPFSLLTLKQFIKEKTVNILNKSNARDAEQI
ncbi:MULTISPECIES: hypothetical protein [unclassified Shewanella]|uniref:hypothetical protein n=1 Tax=unclassified Shewanella TaxID=196818 RepID=UPI000C79F3C4|nr:MULTISPECIES: hypothetical protein [unclassified Shewanella]PKG59093.1 hypothetical protein CXF82_01095 [Shewanella sp. GutDb-MelDb]PKG73499.1 hypothetical protein CXF86_17470 [Shewanella sp. GutCb]